MADKKGDKPKQGKVLPPEKKSRGDTNINNTLIANIHERPDLMLEAFEQNDPGFTKRVMEIFEAELKTTHSIQFWFGIITAYTTLAIRVMAALFCLYLLYLAVTGGGFAFFSIIAVTIFYAISQNGSEGFSDIAKALAKWITKGIKANSKDD